jgi:hypothetical protein
MDPAPLSLNEAVPCGFILNESPANIPEYAFPGGCDHQKSSSLGHALIWLLSGLTPHGNGVKLSNTKERRGRAGVEG